MSLSVMLLMCLTLLSGHALSFLLSGHALSCPVGPPCICRNQTNPYTRKPEYVADCSGHGFTSVPPFTGGEAVDKLLLGGNKIIKLSYNSFLNIFPKSIDLASNGLQIIAAGSFAGMEQCLEELLLGTNNLVLPLPDLKRLSKLKTLNLDYNPKMNLIPSLAFSGLTSLEKLTLSRSYIKSFEPGAFSGLSSLTSLDFYGNSIAEVPTVLSGLSSLTYLNFDSNDIYELKDGAFIGLTSLKELQLSRNTFSNPGYIDANCFVGLGNLETLGFYYALLGSVPSHTFSPLTKLKKLDLSYNNLSRIEGGDLSALMSLTQLDISGNHIKFEPGMFEGIEDSLNYILIRDNGLSSLPVSALSSVQNLQRIDAASSDFPKDLPSNFTQGLSTLNHISLMWMNLTSVKEDTFDGVAEPFDLGIYSNQIKSLNFILDPCKFSYVDVSENPIHCDCHVYNLTQADTTNYQGTCFTPASYNGLDLRGDEFQRKAKEDCSTYPITGPVKCPWN